MEVARRDGTWMIVGVCGGKITRIQDLQGLQDYKTLDRFYN